MTTATQRQEHTTYSVEWTLPDRYGQRTYTHEAGTAAEAVSYCSYLADRGVTGAIARAVTTLIIQTITTVVL